MILFIPEKRVCTNKTTRYSITNLNPLLWIKKEDADYAVTSIDGYIITRDRKVNGIFKKFEYIQERPNEEITIEEISNVFSENEIRLTQDFSRVMKCSFFTFFWPDNFPEGYDISSKLIHSYTFDFPDNRLAIKTHNVLSISQLEKGIMKLRGESFPSVKNLKSASSNVECYLANNTNNPWPGDIDAMIYDKGKNRYLAIIEFKTHNMDSAIEKEHIGKYGGEDWRRFNVLFDLTDNFSQKLGYKPKIFFIVWGTNPNTNNHSNIKIDIIERNSIVKSLLFPRPPYNRFSKDLFTFILQEANETKVR